MKTIQFFFSNNKVTVVLIVIILFIVLFYTILSNARMKEEQIIIIKPLPHNLDTLRQSFSKSSDYKSLSVDSVLTLPVDHNDYKQEQINALMKNLSSLKRPQDYDSNRMIEQMQIERHNRMQVIDFDQIKEKKDTVIKTRIVEIVAVIDKKTSLLNGGNVPIRLSEPLILGDGSIISENTVFQTNCEIQGNRFNLKINRFRNSEGKITKMHVEEVIDFYDLRGGVNRERTKKQIRNEERNRQTRNIISSALANQTSQAESQLTSAFPTGGLISNLVRITTQNTNYIAEATLPENYKIILYVKITEN